MTTSLQDVEEALYTELAGIDWTLSPGPQIAWENVFIAEPRLPRIVVTKGGETTRRVSLDGSHTVVTGFLDFAVLVPKGTGRTQIFAILEDLNRTFYPGLELGGPEAVVTSPPQAGLGFPDGDAYRVPAIVFFSYVRSTP